MVTVWRTSVGKAETSVGRLGTGEMALRIPVWSPESMLTKAARVW